MHLLLYQVIVNFSDFEVNTITEIFEWRCMNTMYVNQSSCRHHESDVRSFLHGILSSYDGIPAKSCSCESRFASFSPREPPAVCSQWFNRQHADGMGLIVFFVARRKHHRRHRLRIWNELINNKSVTVSGLDGFN